MRIKARLKNIDQINSLMNQAKDHYNSYKATIGKNVGGIKHEIYDYKMNIEGEIYSCLTETKEIIDEMLQELDIE